MKKLRRPRAIRVPSAGVLLRSVQDYIDLVWMTGARTGITAMELADKARVHPGTAARHLAGRITTPHLRTAAAILQALGYTVRVRS